MLQIFVRLSNTRSHTHGGLYCLAIIALNVLPVIKVAKAKAFQADIQQTSVIMSMACLNTR